MADDAAAPAARARARAGARDRRLDGRDDRADARRPPPAARALARLDHVQHRRASERPAGAARSTRSSCAARRAGRDAYVAHFERLFARDRLARRSPRDPEEIRELADASYDRDHDPAGPGRQLAAIIASGNRTAELRRIDAPTLVIHGTADPLVRALRRPRDGARDPGRAADEGRRAWATTCRARLWPELIDAIAENAARAGGPPDRHPPLHASRAPLSGLTG